MAEATGTKMAEATGTKAVMASQEPTPEMLKTVLDILAQKKALSLVELMSYVDIPDDDVVKVVGTLERKSLVKVTRPGKLDDDAIVAIREPGLRAVR